MTGLGADDRRRRSSAAGSGANVSPRFFIREGTPTITKRRYVSEPSLLKLFEVAVMDDTPLPAALEDEMLAHLEAALPAYDLVIVTDYGHGFLGPRTVDLLAARARYLAVNTQANPGNLGFHVITRYPRADYVCLDESEARLATGDRWSPAGGAGRRAAGARQVLHGVRDPRSAGGAGVGPGRDRVGGPRAHTRRRRPDGRGGRLPGGLRPMRGRRAGGGCGGLLGSVAGRPRRADRRQSLRDRARRRRAPPRRAAGLRPREARACRA